MKQPMKEVRRPRIVIVGAGFGGLQAAQSLAKANADVLLIDRNNYHTFVPLLYQVVAAQLEPTSITYPVRTLLRRQRNVQFLMAEVRQINFQNKVIETDNTLISYDYLVLATGSQTRWHGVMGAAAHTFPIRTLRDAIGLRNQILQCFEQALQTSQPEVRQQLLCFVIVGGGATGVEVAGALSELIRGPLQQDFPHLVRSFAGQSSGAQASSSFSSQGYPQILLLQSGDRLLPEFPERLGRYTARHLTKLGVKVCLQARIQTVEAGWVQLQSGETIEAATIVWAAGLEATTPSLMHPVSADAQGKLLVRQTLQLLDHPQVYAIGDLAHVVNNGQSLAGVAPEALQQGVTVAKNIRRQIQGQLPQPFRYFNKGRLAIIGGFGGVGKIAGIAFTGALAWLLWLGVHLVYLPGHRNRLIVLLTWLHGYLWRDRPIRQLVSAPVPHPASRNLSAATPFTFKP